VLLLVFFWSFFLEVVVVVVVALYMSLFFLLGVVSWTLWMVVRCGLFVWLCGCKLMVDLYICFLYIDLVNFSYLKPAMLVVVKSHSSANRLVVDRRVESGRGALQHGIRALVCGNLIHSIKLKSDTRISRGDRLGGGLWCCCAGWL